jgi:hypothetical protein
MPALQGEVLVTEAEVINVARLAVMQRGWRWREPARVVRYRRGFAGRQVAVVLTHPNKFSATIRVEIDVTTGLVLAADFLVR